MDTIIPIYFVEYTVFIEDIFKIIILAYLFYSIALWHILQKHILLIKVTGVIFILYNWFIKYFFLYDFRLFNMFIKNFLIILKKFEKRRLNFNFILLDWIIMKYPYLILNI